MTQVDPLRDAFEAIYADDKWSGGSGPGSLPSSTFQYKAFIEGFIYDNSIKSVTDMGCGDWQFSRFINWGAAEYTGVDVVPSLIERNQREFGASNVKFELSSGPQSLPGGDLLLAKEVLQHLPTEAVKEYLVVIKKRYRLALITNSIAPGGVNHDISPGGYRPLRVDLPPFQAKGAYVFSYFAYKPSPFQAWRNAVFLVQGE